MAGLFSLPGEGTGEGDVGAGHIFLSEPLCCRQFTFNILCVHMFNTSLQVRQQDSDRRYV